MQKNRIELAGYLAGKPELRYLPSGTKVSNARLGESYRYRGGDGQFQSHTNWHNLTFYDELADLATTFEQGENLCLEGTLQQRKFTPKDGVTRTVHEVVVKSCHVVQASAYRGSVSVAAELPTEHDGLITSDGIEAGSDDDAWPV